MHSREKPFHYLTSTKSIPIGTRMLSIRYHGILNGSGSSNVSPYCAIDDIKMCIINGKSETAKCNV